MGTNVRPIDRLLNRIIRAIHTCQHCKAPTPEGRRDGFCTDECAEQHQIDFAI